METWLDLHMHTKYSMDGQFEPADLMRQCADAGVTTVAVTDHDSARAIPEARQEAARLGLNLVPGIEISCQYKGRISTFSAMASMPRTLFLRPLKRMYTASAGRFQKRSSTPSKPWASSSTGRLSEVGSGDAVASVHIAHVALADPRNADCPVLAPYRPGGARSDAPYVNFGWDICGQEARLSCP